MITRGLIEKIYSAASMQRWNDHARPMELVELDKQAHKMMFAYVIGKGEEQARPGSVNWINLIEGGIFEFLQRLILTDLKPAVYHRMMNEVGTLLNQYVVRKLHADLARMKGGFEERFEKYLLDHEYASREKRILKAAHYLATNWEFKIIYNLNSFMYGIERTRQEIECQIDEHNDLPGVKAILEDKKLYGFLDLCGQLRFQQRWAQTPRIPRTTVLGHLLVVALFTYFIARELDACDRRLYNDFFAALFHDLPEVMTRDIVSPVKESVEGLDEIIKEYERKQLEGEILTLLPPAWHAEMRYLVQDEFSNKAVVNGQPRIVPEITDEYNTDASSPVDGKIIRVCDKLAAFIEASISIEHGITSSHLINARKKVYTAYKGTKMYGIKLGYLFDYFE